MQRRLCEMSEAKWSIAEAKCLQMLHNKYASQRDAISPLYGNLMLSHSAGMQHPDISIAGISKRFHFASLHYIFSAYLPTHIKFLTEFHRIFFGTTCISFHFLSTTTVPQKAYLTTQSWISNNTNATHYYHTPIWIYLENTPVSYIFALQKTRWVRRKKRFGRLSQVIRVNSRTSHNNNQIFFNEK